MIARKLSTDWETWECIRCFLRPASLRLPLSGQTLRLCDLCRRHLGGNQVAVLAAIGSPAGTRKIEPHVRQKEVLRHTVAVGIHEPEVVLGVGIALIRCEPLRANTDETSTPRKFTLEGYR